jgi:hypothetical protein
MHETMRMLGQEHQADLQRDADKWRGADEVRRQRASGDTPLATQAHSGTMGRAASLMMRVVSLSRALTQLPRIKDAASR